MQSSLFQTGACLFDGDLGRIAYFPNCVAPHDADAWFEQLRDQVAWKSARRMMYEREVDVPRLVAHFALDAPELPSPLQAAAGIAQHLAECAFNNVGLNFYRDDQDSVAPHNDKLHELTPGAPIALLSAPPGAWPSVQKRRRAKPCMWNLSPAAYWS